MKFALVILAGLFALPVTGAVAQEVCQKQYATCVDKCSQSGAKDSCFVGCQSRNTACSNAAFTKPKPSYDGMKRPPDPNDGKEGIDAVAAEPAVEKAEKPARPARRAKRQ